ncbi:MAG: Cytochrome c oxidase subunit 3 [Turneriella sp.]|nr:Cytochrome c oxidase subunit 3 [Turneriella sp.]
MQTATFIPQTTRTGIPNAVLGVLVLVGAELMFFTGLISSYLVNRISSRLPWPPVDQPRLPVEATAVNTAILLLSGLLLYLAVQGRVRIELRQNVARIAVFLGLVFLIIQGSEWVRLLGFGITVHSSLFGAFFYTLIGAHGLHVLGGILAITPILFRKEPPSQDTMRAAAIYWYFVVLLWPLLYFLLYLL